MTDHNWTIAIAVPGQPPHAYMDSTRIGQLSGPWTGIAANATRMTGDEAALGAADWSDYLATKGHEERCHAIKLENDQ